MTQCIGIIKRAETFSTNSATGSACLPRKCRQSMPDGVCYTIEHQQTEVN